MAFGSIALEMAGDLLRIARHLRRRNTDAGDEQHQKADDDTPATT